MLPSLPTLNLRERGRRVIDITPNKQSPNSVFVVLQIPTHAIIQLLCVHARAHTRAHARTRQSQRHSDCLCGKESARGACLSKVCTKCTAECTTECPGNCSWTQQKARTHMAIDSMCEQSFVECMQCHCISAFAVQNAIISTLQFTVNKIACT